MNGTTLHLDVKFRSNRRNQLPTNFCMVRERRGPRGPVGRLGLVLNMVVLWDTIYMQAAIEQLRRGGFEVRDEDVARLFPLLHGHVNVLGRYSFSIPDAIANGGLRELRNPEDTD